MTIITNIWQAQKKKKEKELLPEGIKCYTCGLENIDPEEDKVFDTIFRSDSTSRLLSNQQTFKT